MTFSEAIRARRGGSRDGAGAGDHDKPYTFGHRPTVAAPFPFSTRELARLLVLRSQLARRGGDACVVGSNNHVVEAGAEHYPLTSSGGGSAAHIDGCFAEDAA